VTDSIYQYLMPTKIVHGPGSTARLGNEARLLKGTKALIVSDAGVQAAGLLAPVLDSLREAGLEAIVFVDVPADPDIEVVRQGTALGLEAGCDLVVAVGGGSPMCAGKSIAIVATNGGSIRDYEGFGRVKVRPWPVIAIPTTAGSGTEVSAVTILADKERRIKMAIASPLTYPPVAILDPALLVSLPFRQAVVSGIDALCHAIEAYLTSQATPLTDAIALRAVEMLSANLLRAASTRDLASKDACLLGSSMANIACGNARLGLTHALGWPVSCLYDVPHGVANGILLPYVLEFTLPAAVERMAQLGAAMGNGAEKPPAGSREQQAAQFIHSVKRLLVNCSFPRAFDPKQVDPAGIPQMVGMLKEGVYALFSQVNLRPAAPADMTALYERAFQGWKLD
jgi:alcohol dehydrogenase class IV